MRIYHSIQELSTLVPAFETTLSSAHAKHLQGLCGFDGFVDTFVRMNRPASMAEFGPKIAQAAGIAASYSVTHEGDRFGGNGPLFVSALHDLFGGHIDLHYAGGVGAREMEPLFAEALKPRLKAVYPMAPPAHTDCLEFTDGKVMLNDFGPCGDITLARLLEVMGEAEYQRIVDAADFIVAVNWGKLPHVGEIWADIAYRRARGPQAGTRVPFFMDLAEFEHRPADDVEQLLALLPRITEVFSSILSFNLKEAWQMGETLGGGFTGRKQPEAVAELAAFLKEHIQVDRVVIHPNSGAACASDDGVVYVAGPYCENPLISTGAGDNFGAGCLSGYLMGLDDTGMLLAGNAASGFYVRSGRSATFTDLLGLVKRWQEGTLPERL
ncbi:MAG: PfkB family carbohydrate kinase [Spirochaetaceae bacterium]